MTSSSANKSIVVKLLVITIIMFGFGYALVPLYDAFCKATGFGGKTDVVNEATAQTAALSNREVDVSFTTSTNTQLPWEFKALTKALTVKIGEIQTAKFYVKNYSDRPIVGMATFNVTPPRAGFHFKKTECFCFTQQTLQPGEEKEVIVRFMLDQKMPKDVHELTLSYTFFDNKKYAGK